MLVICEVKTRSGLRYGSPLEAISRRKRARLRRLAVTWIWPPTGLLFDEVRIDVIGLVRDRAGRLQPSSTCGEWADVPVARTHAIALVGVEGHPVEVEADIENGLAGLLLVGLPDTALREARDRIRAAIVNSREHWPQRRITVGLSPASLPKRGSGFDVGIAVAILARGGRGAR